MYSDTSSSYSSRRNTHQSSPSEGIPKIVWILLGIIVLFIGWRMIAGGGSENQESSSESYILVSTGTGSSPATIFVTDSSKKTVEPGTEEKLFDTDIKFSAPKGGEKKGGESSFVSSDKSLRGYLNGGAEIAYLGSNETKEGINIINGSVWIENAKPVNLTMKNIQLNLGGNSTLIAYQTTIASTVSLLQGQATLTIGEHTVELNAGNQISIQNTDTKIPGFDPEKEIRSLSEEILSEDPLFQNHGGEDIMKNIITPSSSSGTGSSNATGTIIGTGTKITGTGVILGGANTSIRVTSPLDESTVSTATFDVVGTIENPAIAKIMINGVEASLNPLEQSFVSKDIAASTTSNETDVIYRGYDIDGNLLTKGLITIHTSSKTATTNKPNVTSYPINDAEFQIITPTENPYKTTENVVKIEGVVPKGVVKYITINGFRLTKFSAFSTKWYYFANKDYSTMGDGINLYTIRYYNDENKMIAERLFTIVKENIIAQ